MRLPLPSNHRCLSTVVLCGLLTGLGVSAAAAARQEAKKPKDGAHVAGLAEYMKETEAQIKKVMAENAKLPKKPIAFGCNMILAHGSLVNRVPLEVLEKYADAIKEAGAQRVELNPVVRAHGDAEALKKYKALVEHIRKLGLKIALNPESFDPKFAGISTFAEYEKEALRQYAQWAAELKPDHFVLVHEPTTMASRMHLKTTTPKDWRGFIEATAKVVKHAAPKARIGAGCFAGLSDRELPFFEEFAKIHELEFLTFDNYVGDPKALARMDHMVKTAREAKKPVYMEETWRPHFVDKNAKHVEGQSMEAMSVLGFGYSGFEPLDEQWIEAMALYAATHGLESMTVFQTRCLFLYVPSKPTDGPDFDKKVEEAILHGKRTKTFDALRKCAKEFGHR